MTLRCSGGWIRTTTVRINSPLPCRWATPDRTGTARVPSRIRTCDLDVRSVARCPAAPWEQSLAGWSRTTDLRLIRATLQPAEPRRDVAVVGTGPHPPVLLTRTRRGIRTPNLPTLNRTPLPLGYPGMTMDQPALRAEDSNPQPPGSEPGVPPVAPARIELSNVDLGGFEPPTPGLPNRCATTAPQAHLGPFSFSMPSTVELSKTVPPNVFRACRKSRIQTCDNRYCGAQKSRPVLGLRWAA
jgi:hypothetical protein